MGRNNEHKVTKLTYNASYGFDSVKSKPTLVIDEGKKQYIVDVEKSTIAIARNTTVLVLSENVAQKHLDLTSSGKISKQANDEFVTLVVNVIKTHLKSLDTVTFESAIKDLKANVIPVEWKEIEPKVKDKMVKVFGADPGNDANYLFYLELLNNGLVVAITDSMLEKWVEERAINENSDNSSDTSKNSSHSGFSTQSGRSSVASSSTSSSSDDSSSDESSLEQEQTKRYKRRP